MKTARRRVSSSFRDPSGFVFEHHQEIFRQINLPYQKDYDHLLSSGLYQALVDKGLLIPHEEVDIEPHEDGAYKIIKPEPLEFVAYPYEWSFSQLKDAALTTLRIQKLALKHGMTLKDCSAYNIQFHRGRPVFIDTLSFEQYQEGQPWVAYRQFCQHFLAPLTLMAYRDVRLGRLLQIYIDGIPLDLASSLLPKRTKLQFSVLSHIHLHASVQRRHEDKTTNRAQTTKVSLNGVIGVIDNLRSFIKKLSWKPAGTQWGDYYEFHNYSDESLAHKGELVGRYLDKVKPKRVWDLGANTGLFSRVAAERGIRTIAFDIDPAAVEKHYLFCKKEKIEDVYPLQLDLTNPSPGIGWAGRERESFVERGPTDAALALALIHHLAIANNVPLPHIADFFASISEWLIIEFVPKSDSQVVKMLSTREDIFPLYNEEGFEAAFAPYFEILDKERVGSSDRTLYLMKAKRSR